MIVFVWFYLLKQRQINGGQKQNCAHFNLSSGTFYTCLGESTSTLPLHRGREASRETLHLINFIFLCNIQKQFNFTPRAAFSFCCCCGGFCGKVPFPPLFQLPLGQRDLTLGGYVATSRFGVHLTSPDILQMWLHVKKTILKNLRGLKTMFLKKVKRADKAYCSGGSPSSLSWPSISSIRATKQFDIQVDCYGSQFPLYLN